MSMTRVSKALLQESVNKVAEHGSITAGAAALGICRPTMQSRMQSAKLRGIRPGKTITDIRDPQHLACKIKRLEVELKQAHSKQLDEQAIRDTIIKLSYEAHKTPTPDWAIAPRGSADKHGVPTLFLSDWHWDEVVQPSQINGVNKYNRKIAHERARSTVEAAIHLLKILSPKLDYLGIVVPLGGDIISGNIHDELTTTNEFNTMPTILDVLGVLKWCIGTLVEEFGQVFLPCVTGNHGRNTQKIWHKDRHATSFDWLIYGLLAEHFQADKRIRFLIPDGPDAYYRIFNHRYLLTHGDQFRGGDGMIGALGPIIRGDHKKRSRNAQIDMEYDTMLLGHWHQLIYLNRLIVNGSLKGMDEYAYSNNFPFEQPQQALWITHPTHGINWSMPVQPERQRAKPKTAWVSVAK